MIYLDSSAILKLVRDEPESSALRHWLSDRPDLPLITSELGRVETLRAAHRIGAAVPTRAQAVIDDFDLVPLDRPVQDLACDLDNPHLRTLDALHLASALLIARSLTAFVVYDQRLAEAARSSGLPVKSPSVSPPAAPGPAG